MCLLRGRLGDQQPPLFISGSRQYLRNYSSWEVEIWHTLVDVYRYCSNDRAAYVLSELLIV